MLIKFFGVQDLFAKRSWWGYKGAKPPEKIDLQSLMR
jgi:hypothetical protein